MRHWLRHGGDMTVIGGVLIAFGAIHAWSQTIYVDADRGDDGWTGRCAVWDGGVCGPKASIQAGIDAALPGDEVVIADGMYAGPENRNLGFGGKALTVRSVSGDPANCTIDCQGSGPCFWFVSNEGADSIVRGLTIRNGSGDFGGAVTCCFGNPTLIRCVLTGNTANYHGGGIYCEDASPTLIDSTISGNTAHGMWGGGGGVYCISSNPTLINCTIASNTCDGSAGACGGGVLCYGSSPSLTGCVLTANVAESGGGMFCDATSSPTLTKCRISGNEARATGGGVHCESSSPVIADSWFEGNVAGWDAGGLSCYRSAPLLTNCTITGNTAAMCGGGVCCWEYSSPGLTNCLITGNVAQLSAVYCYFFSRPTLANCTISSNAAGGAAALYCDENCQAMVTSCIFWADTPREIDSDGGEPVLTYCDVQGGWVGLGNIHAEPLFRDSLSANYRLRLGSPCIDAGDPDLAPPPGATDLDGNPRVCDGDADGQARVDVGAFEVASAITGDMNCDGLVNVFDIDPFVLALTDPASYARTFAGCDVLLADCNGDGVVNAFDIDPFVALLVRR